jgi:hypothetical protein
MRTRFVKACTFVGIVSLALMGASLAAAAEQSKASSVINFEVISVDGNYLVIRDQNGTRALTVPDGFRFTVDGKSISVNELAAGMKGTATVTTTTTTHPVFVTEIRKGTVLRKSGQSIIIRGQDGTRRFTQDEADANAMEIFMNGKPVKVWQLKQGDEFTALVVTKAAPVVLTEKEVAATLAQPPEPEPEPVAAAAPAEQPAPAPAPEPMPTPAPPMQEAAAPATPAPVAPAPVPAAPKEDSGWLMWLLVVVVIAVVAFLLMRRRSSKT